MITITVRKMKETLNEDEQLPPEPDWNLLKKAGFKSKILGKRVWNSLVNTKRDTGQEAIMNYYNRLFRKFKKQTDSGDKDATYFDWYNSKDYMVAYITLNEEAGPDQYAENAYERLKFALYTMKVGDALTGQSRYEQTKKEMENKFVENFRKKNKSRLSPSQIKTLFRNFWEEKINLTLTEASIKFCVFVSLYDDTYPDRSIGLEGLKNG